MNAARKERLKNGILKTGEIAKKANLLPSCIRYYAKMGLLDVYSRTQGKFCLYKQRETLKKIQRIKTLKVQGISLETIREKINKR